MPHSSAPSAALVQHLAHLVHRASCVDPGTLCEDAVLMLRDALGAEWSELVEPLPHASGLWLRAGAGWRAGLVGRTRLGPDAPGARALRDAATVEVHDEPAAWRAGLYAEHGVHCGLSAPIFGREGGLGALGVYSAGPRVFSSSERAFLEGVAHTLSAGLARAQAEQRHQELARQNAALEDFAVTAAHDLKSPLVTILGFLSYCQRDLAAGNVARVEEDLGRLTRAAETLRARVEGLLSLSRAGHTLGVRRLTPLYDLAREALLQVEGRRQQRGAEVIVPEGLPSVFGDPARLVEVLLNLFDNALKFTPPEERPRVELCASADPAGVSVWVRDHGSGISAEYASSLFTRFVRLSPAVDGTGLGLARVKQIVEAHGGRVWLETTPGGGASVGLWFPAAPRAAT